MTADRLERLLNLPDDEVLSDDLEEWLRQGLREATLGNVPLDEALDLKGKRGKSSAYTEVRRRLRDKILREVGEQLLPRGSLFKQVSALMDVWEGGKPAEPKVIEVLQQANRLAPLPAYRSNLYMRLSRLNRCNHFPETAIQSDSQKKDHPSC